MNQLYQRFLKISLVSLQRQRLVHGKKRVLALSPTFGEREICALELKAGLSSDHTSSSHRLDTSVALCVAFIHHISIYGCFWHVLLDTSDCRRNCPVYWPVAEYTGHCPSRHTSHYLRPAAPHIGCTPMEY